MTKNFSYQFSDTIPINWLIQNMPQFLFPNLSKQQARIEKPFMGVLAVHNRQPVGLILTTAESTHTIYRIHSFLVQPNFQRQGIGLRLLKTLEKYIRERGGQRVEGSYRNHWKSVAAIKKILKREDWQTPEPQLIIAKGRVAKVLSYFSKTNQVISGLTILPFTQLKKSDIEYIQKKQATNRWFDPDLFPFMEEQTIHLACSFLVKKEGEIIGWLVAHRINARLNEWTALFIDPRFRTFKLTHALIQHGFEQQKKAGIPKFLVTSRLDGNAVGRLLQRVGEEYGVFCTTTYFSFKRLG